MTTWLLMTDVCYIHHWLVTGIMMCSSSSSRLSVMRWIPEFFPVRQSFEAWRMSWTPHFQKKAKHHTSHQQSHHTHTKTRVRKSQQRNVPFHIIAHNINNIHHTHNHTRSLLANRVTATNIPILWLSKWAEGQANKMRKRCTKTWKSSALNPWLYSGSYTFPIMLWILCGKRLLRLVRSKKLHVVCFAALSLAELACCSIQLLLYDSPFVRNSLTPSGVPNACYAASMDEGSGKENKGRAYQDHEISYKEFHDYYDLGTNHFSKIGTHHSSLITNLLV